MLVIEYRRWAPLESPLSVEFTAELLLGLGQAESCGLLHGWRRGTTVRLTRLAPQDDEEQEKAGVFVSRIRGEVFLTEADLQFMNQEGVDVALVVAGGRAGFFVREANGAIQTVRSHEEFSIQQPAAPPVSPPVPLSVRPGWIKWRERIPNGAVAMAALPLVALGALAVLPRRVTPSRSIEVREVEHQLRISWQPARNAVLTIDDSGARMAIPVAADQSSATYAMTGPEVEVSLISVDEKNQLRRISTRFTPKRSGP